MDCFSRMWLALVYGARFWPMGLRNAVAHVASFILWYVVPIRRRVVRTNLRLCFPEKTEAERRAIARECIFWAARAMIDHGTLWRGSPEDIRKLVTLSPEFLKVFNDESQRPLLMISAHCCGLDATGQAMTLLRPIICLYLTQRSAVWDEAIVKGRDRFHRPIMIRKTADGTGHDILQIVRAMKKGNPFYYFPDMDYGRRNAEFIDFFGVPAATITTASRLAKVSGAKVIFCFSEMTKSGYYLHATDIWKGFPTDDPVADTERITREIEKWIRRFPSQYMWMHRRFKTRPEGEESFY